MGYNDENLEPLILDIETMPREGIDDFIDVPEAPSNYKDPEKIFEFKLEKLRTVLDTAALDIFLNRVVAIGTWTASQGVNVVIAKDLAEERTHLAALAFVIRNAGYRRRVVTFNGLFFDLPCVMERALQHELEFPSLDITPPWRSPHTDLMDVMTYGGKFKKRSLDFYCRIYGIDSDESDQVKALHGADIPKLAAEGQWDLIAGHCRHDVIRTAKLAQRRKVIAA
jgi:uncharacterized protein YprB with RNaseH-like and TPR domain